LYPHCVWATWDRLPLLTEALDAPVQAVVRDKCRELGRVPLALGGVTDHLHLLVRFPTTLPVATLVQAVKGASSHLVTHVLHLGGFFKWQGGYGACTVQPDGLATVQAYIAHQQAHHAAKRLISAWELCDTEDEPDA